MFNVQNLTNTFINVKWGLEIVWCLLTPKNISHDSKIQHIACAAIYSKPGSKYKSDLYDHISEAFNLLSMKYSRGLHFCLAGDTNELDLNPILNISPNFVQLVTEPTRYDPNTNIGKILDPIIMTMSSYYQSPVYLEPLDPDSDTNGRKSDHRIVILRPVSAINNKSARTLRTLKY